LEAQKDLAFHQLAKQSQGERQLQKVSEFLKATFQQRAQQIVAPDIAEHPFESGPILQT
jgi:hypothetical protein